jgi:peptidoglycan hydrolase-like protein with peptidoglycan-binding domain
VRKLQGELAELGYTDAKGRALHTDGHFGPSTEAAVKAFQNDHGLTPDGQVGTLTQGMLHDVTQSSREATAALSGTTSPATAEMSCGCPYVDRLMATVNDPAAFSQAIRDVATSPYGDAFRAEGRALNMEVQNQQLQQQVDQQQTLQAQPPVQQGPVMSR